MDDDRARRRRLRAIGGAVALTLGVVVGTAVVAGPRMADGVAPFPSHRVGAADPPTVQTGERLVGLGKVVVAVPSRWETNALDECGRPAVATVWFQLEDPARAVDYDCISPLRQVPSVTFATLDTEAGRRAAEAARTSSGDGTVLRGTFVCPPNADCSFSASEAPRYLVVPSENVAVILSGPRWSEEILDRIADSFQVLPDGWTTVPYVRGSYAVEWARALAEAGLVADATAPRCGPGDACVELVGIHPQPAVGSAVEVGSRVDLYPPY